ncbi:(d)CMP kinase [Bacteroides ovatus]|uniref:(d)CMP kinase n=1 Tax=Bacteroides ovatus TaxID=28116 RepID=UPI00202F10C5|nr:cytidylate kinase family protein [Bacteroides ovatus]MCM1722369.1 cytidylate kinase family protein [Bacteroides ovatus]MCM1756077.1 cytidylate kinase family protein [Bacteroides ovatus]MCM1867692.1 cytidylate kinase family protein [Bacteroides ovatus]MCM1908710.1 cytidylate kinase family protein [Bacteroides ovatus]
MKHITITGDLGSGKSAVAKILSGKLNMEIISTGAIQREIAMKYGMTTLELNKYAENHPEIDEMIDNAIRNIGKQEKYYIIDSRLAWFFIPNSFKIYLQVDVDIAADRIKGDKRDTEKYDSHEKAVNDIKARKKSENQRYLGLYGADCSNLDNFDLIIDTSKSTPEEIADLIISIYKCRGGETEINKYWFSPLQLLPTQSVRRLNIGNLRDEVKSSFDICHPIKIISHGGLYFIYDGHKRTSAAFFNHVSLVPVSFITEETMPFQMKISEYVNDHYKQSYVYDWEDIHQVNYLKYWQNE